MKIPNFAGLELREDVDTVLQPGMILSMEPMLMIPEGQPGAGGYRYTSTQKCLMSYIWRQMPNIYFLENMTAS